MLALACAACIGNAGAADWNATGVWLLYGDTFELGDPERTTTRLEHADGWKYGDNYFFADFVKSTGNTTAYAEFEPRLSLGKITGRPMKLGPIKDVLLNGSVNFGEDFTAYLYGASVDLDVPGFAWFKLMAYGRDDENLPGRSWQVTPAWLLPFKLGPLQFGFQGFIDWIGAEGPAVRNLLIVPRLWIDAGALWGAPGHLEVGVEYFWWQDKYGIEGVDEEVVEPAVKWTF